MNTAKSLLFYASDTRFDAFAVCINYYYLYLLYANCCEDNEPEKCDISDGEWVPNKGSPVYTNNTCRWIESHQNCMGNGRPDTGYMYWKWSPKGCDLPRFDAERFLEMMRDKSWAFVGDSINRNHLQSFICLLSQVISVLESCPFYYLFVVHFLILVF